MWNTDYATRVKVLTGVNLFVFYLQYRITDPNLLVKCGIVLIVAIIMFFVQSVESIHLNLGEFCWILKFVQTIKSQKYVLQILIIFSEGLYVQTNVCNLLVLSLHILHDQNL